MSGVMGKFLVTGIVLSSIVACSSSSDGGSGFKAPTNKVSACEFKFADGGSADFSALNTSNTAQAYFEKEYNANYFNAVSVANAETTLDFVNQTGATVYKSDALPRSACGFNLFETANTMTLDVEARWNAATKDDGPKTGYVLGLYLPQTTQKTYPSLNKGAAIVIRENTDRWTLVHEFMHHLFMLRSVEQGHNDDVMKEAIGTSAAEIEAIDKDYSIPEKSQKFLKKVPSFVKLVTEFDKLMIHYSLEEITIEATMKDAVQSGRLKYVPTGGSNWYINTNAKKAYGYYQGIEDEANDYITYLPANAWTEKLQINELLDLTAKRKKMIKDMAARYPYDEAQGGVKVIASQIEQTGCSHEAEVQKIFDRVGGIIKKH